MADRKPEPSTKKPTLIQWLKEQTKSRVNPDFYTRAYFEKELSYLRGHIEAEKRRTGKRRLTENEIRNLQGRVCGLEPKQSSDA